MRTLCIAVLLAQLSLLGGCSTIFGDRYNYVELTTEPAAAEYTVRNGAGDVVASGVTPNTIKLKSSAGYFKRGHYSVAFSAPGHADQVVDLVAGMRGIYWGNILVGGPIGLLIVDPASGAMWVLPRKVAAILQPAGEVISSAPSLGLPQTPVLASREQQLQELRQLNLGYEEYQRRYAITKK